ncbi:hypothetical protein [Nocardia sp. SYP-A9097]|uniref:hypothetical protein n=1 Tax=Nocardia sp. SYP-A9097 TaxID=2663237 RepID=UPI0035C8AB1E
MSSTLLSAVPPRTLCEAFQTQVAAYPEWVALRTLGGAQTLTWREYGAPIRWICWSTSSAMRATGP